jgi:two-component system cell cycle response regulator
MSACILVVDDLLPNIKLLEAKLTNEYYDVLTAKNGFEALEILKQKPVDIVLLDVMMPEMDGFETCKRIKADPNTVHLPVVMVTALSEVEDRVHGLEAGADDFLTKPINDMALFARIRSLVRLKIMLDELRLRDQTGIQLGLINNFDNNALANVQGANILIIDDDIVQAQQLTNRLTTIQASVKVLSDPAIANEEALNGNFDLIIISTQLINADGLRICSHIRSHEKVRHVPLLILVEENDTQVLVKGLDMGVNDYLVTPIDGNEVIARVKTQLRRKKYQDALKNNYQQSINMALTDGLTGIYNRRYFDVHFKTLIDEANTTSKPLSIILLDIDHFKKINDTYGHVAGDEALKQLAEIVTQNIRLTDLFARYGGEEFVIVLPDSDVESSKNIGERLRSAVEKYEFKISTGEGKLKYTISAGIAKLLPGDTTESLLKRADKGLYMCKEGGRNKVIYVEQA